MCELFGINSAEAIRCNGLLQEFFEHGESNPDGWGIAAFYGNSVSLEKEPVSSLESAYLKNRLTEEIVIDKLIAHIRKASKGGIEYKNSHPFIRRDMTDRTWTLAHNGTIFENKELDPYVSRQKGQTDSERILYYLVDCVNAAEKKAKGNLKEEERFGVVDRVVHTITPENKVNLLIYDGDLFYVHTNQKDTLYACQKTNSLLVSTKPLKQDYWENIPMNTLLAYRDGELVYTGNPHDHEYRENEKKTKYMFLDYANI
ncbi:MAG: class II glutamine amidotransferase [Bacteroidales bacterium]|nr:class II glutamine amidotransferase [Bacteroidales bacterium]MCM1415387.1 class II glutamine amidotransferase [bacterium]MCM1423320.1 class II glutamine amidotransferase [bacterium]